MWRFIKKQSNVKHGDLLSLDVKKMIFKHSFNFKKYVVDLVNV